MLVLMKSTFAVVLLALQGLACSGDDVPPPADSGPGDASDGAAQDAADAADAADTGPTERPALAVYTVKTDGSELTLLADTGTQLYSHVRRAPGSDWLTATRYGIDLDGNGLAMEGEGGGAPNYFGTEILVFRRSAPTEVHVVSVPGLVCGDATSVCANSSWTEDGKLILINSHAGSTPRDWLKRVSFGDLPTATEVEPLELPAGLFFPVDPHQQGDSTTGTVVFSGTYNEGTVGAPRWTRPLWKVPAAGTTTIGPGQAEFIGCPTCESEGGECCSVSDFRTMAVHGTNDARISHGGEDVRWMQSSPEASGEILGMTLFPNRQFGRPMSGGSQVALDEGSRAPTTSQAYGNWSPDDSRLVYWEVQILGSGPSTYRVAEKLYTANPDGTNRHPVPLPDDLCANHPSYLDDDTVIFSGWRCGGPNCTCTPDQISAP